MSAALTLPDATDTQGATLRISEIFGPTIQGEGALIGEPTVFVRTGGCDYRCTWCDTLHAVDARFRDTWRPMTTAAIWAEVERLSGGVPLTVSLSGGNPAIQPFGALIALGHRHGYRFALETQGSIARDWFAALDTLVLSPKPPSSGMTTDWAALDACVTAAAGGPAIVLKVVVFDDADYAFARAVARRLPALPVCLQPGNPTPPPAEGPDPAVDLGASLAQMRWLVGRVTDDRWFSARVLPQLHVLLWGNLRGV
ncbi:organic radical activating enzyme [Ameyamaea chiangmaiensis NBRC 103196]|uniref:7-carboxy-7-deazaguanine synthase QueE n=1 Tax=Ameyamaea chiangmaiensis TaxID=442969 RepID=UPI002156C9CE|nr:7-carboxy-7-deazaguanine synthase QueE [Ameyamaea chiangmaiensis]GBQ63093.1 organic radical activating enzyme [Ameyamaea chiangmaiensis NBRC 103196]